MKIKAHKGGRTARIGARLTEEEKAEVMAKVKADGYKSFSDWLIVQIARPTLRAADMGYCGCTYYAGFEKIGLHCKRCGRVIRPYR